MSPTSPIATFLLGLFGTAHCVGMCGPIIVAIPAKSGRLVPQLLYHLGRITTYALVCAALGAASSLAGGPAELTNNGPPLAALAHAQVVLSLLAAALMLTLGLVRLGIVREPAWLRGPSLARLPGFTFVRTQALKGHALAMLPLGLLLGLLPCGLSYGAFAAALTAQGATAAGLMGLAFGMGTLPGLLLLGTALSRVVRRHQRMVDAAAGVLLIGIGALVASDALEALLG